MPAQGWRSRLWRKAAVRVPGSGEIVELAVLERHMLATAIWDLSVRGRVTIEERPPYRIGRPAPWQLVVPKRSSDEADRSGLEGSLDAGLPPSPIPVDALASTVWARDLPLPLNALVVAAQRQLVHLGLARPTGPSSSARHSRVPLMPDVCVEGRALTSLRASFEELRGRWTAEDPRWTSRLVCECGYSLAGVRPTFQNTGGGG